MFEKDLSLNLLFDTYGELLPENQRDMFEQYYCDDLSLSEIAENAGITRQGVRDRIDKARRALTMYEEKLGFVKKLSELEAARRKAAEKLSARTEKEAKELITALENAEKAPRVLIDEPDIEYISDHDEIRKMFLKKAK